jgi:hypothetical protein
MKWLLEASQSPATDQVSSSRVIALAAGFTLSVSTLALTIMVWWKPELITPLTVFGGALATMAGGGYVTNRIMSGTEKKHDPDPNA